MTASEKKKDKETQDPTFEKVLERLEAIAEKLEAGDVPLESALALFEEGVSLAKLGNNKLDGAEKKLEILRGDNVSDLSAAATNEP